MRLGPIQLVIIGFNNDDYFDGRITNELDAIRGRGVVKLIDLLFVHKNDAGELTITTRTDIGRDEESTYGAALERLLGGSADSPADDGLDDDVVGIGLDEVQETLADLKPGHAIAVALFEHTWAAALSEAIREAGGRLVAQGTVTREATLLMDEELNAIADAEIAVAARQAVRGAEVLDSLVFGSENGNGASDLSDTEAQAAVDAALESADDAMATAVAAETLRTLIVAGVVDDTEVETAMVALIEAGLLDPVLVEQGLESADAALAGVADVAAAQAARETRERG